MTRRLSRALTARVLGAFTLCLLAYSMPARAVTMFECGNYTLHGKLEAEASSSDFATLVLFEKSLSELRIRARLSPEMSKFLREEGKSPILGFFSVDILDGGHQPAQALLRNQVFLSAPVQAHEGKAIVHRNKTLSCSKPKVEPAGH